MATLISKNYVYEVYAGEYIDGKWEKTPTIGAFQGSVQPMTGKEIQSLNVGRQDTGKIKIYTDTDLQISLEGKEYSGTIVFFDNKKWELIQKLRYNSGLIDHYKYIGEYRGEEE